MKMQKRLALLLLIILAAGLIAGCAAEPVETQPPTQTTTEPTEPKTEPPTDPPTEPPTEPATAEPTDPPTEPDDETRLAAFRDLFKWESDTLFCRAAGYEYARAADVDLYYLFYNGVDYPGSWSSIAESEQELLLRENFWREMDIQILPANLLEEKLQRYFGVGLDDVTIPADWVYSPETDTYYSNHNDAYVNTVEVADFAEQPDGTVVLYLTVDAVHDHDYEEVVWNAPVNMTIRPVEGGWQIVSNVLAG